MAGVYVALDLMYLEHRERRLEERDKRREWRETRDPFELHDDEFMERFGLTPDVAQELIEELRPHLERQRPYGISVEHQVLSALRFYATGCYQSPVGDSYYLTLSQPSISRCVRGVSEAINTHMLRPWVRFPMTPDERLAAKMKFKNSPQMFEGTIGAMDCTYVQILAPREHEEAYVNHWGDHSLNVQAICDPDLQLLNVNARYPVARNDYFIWTNSAAKRVMERNFDDGERNTWLIADDGYFLEPWLMTPLKNEVPGSPRFLYNDALCSARSVIERCFGVWKSVFRCLSAQRKLMYEPKMAAKIVNACAVLHNMRLENNIQAEIQTGEQMQVNDIQNNNDSADRPLRRRALAERIQACFIAQHFGH